MRIASLVGVSVVLVLGGCHSGPAIRASADVVKVDLERARRNNALRCAPRELATAEASLDFLSGELDEGDATRAFEHLTQAEASAKRALALSRDCAPKQVVVKEDSRPVVKIEETDTDGDGLADKDDQCPSLPGPADTRGCPREAPRDRDGDGISEALDRCPEQKEDLDGFEDEDGCPDLDNDRDGIVDGSDKCPSEAGPLQNVGCPVLDRDGDGVNDDVDKCPNEPEDKDGFQDDDGCPDLDNDGDGLSDDRDECPTQPGPAENKGCPRPYSLVAVTRDRIEIKKQIKFATGSAKFVGAESEKILDEVALAMNDNKQLKKIRVEGHTDSVGDDSGNLRLSQNRANSVMSALIKRKVDPSRLEAVGFGETRPIASNSTASGRAENRRTEFNITEQ
jgi:outer membrane protein OmpA-like peptidoglycan-associated protein